MKYSRQKISSGLKNKGKVLMTDIANTAKQYYQSYKHDQEILQFITDLKKPEHLNSTPASSKHK